MTYDTIILRGSIIDGTGKGEYTADIGIKDGIITKIGNLETEDAYMKVNASGKKVTPGFIDIHDHSDTTILAGHMLDSYFMQGVTTVVGGQCGFSPAPVKNEENLKNITDWLPEWDMQLTWNSFESYLEAVEKAKPGINFACMVGHGAIRTEVMGFENRECTPDELEQMKKVLKEALEGGAIGFSTGLEYMPGASAAYEEILELCKVTAMADKLYATHQRSRDKRFAESLDEAIQSARESGTRLQISHTAPRWWAPSGTAEMVKTKIEEARAEGIDVACDYIITNYSTCYLMSFLPSWAFDKGIEGLERYLSDFDSREEMKKFDDHILGEIVKRKAWDKVILSFCSKNKDLIGRTLKEIGELKGCDPQDVIFDIIKDEGENYLNVSAQILLSSDDDIAKMMTPEYSFPEPDVWGMSMFDKLKGNVMSGPSGYAWTVEYLKKFIKEKQVLTLEEGIRCITSLPAEKMRFNNRGRIEAGMYADVVVFDYENLKSNSTIADPNNYPSGFEYVFVNGVCVAENGNPTGKTGGMVIKG